MRIALAKNTLQVPPTYFALSHATMLQGSFDFRFFTLAARVTDPSVRIPVQDFVPFRTMDIHLREKLLPAAMPAMSRAIRRFQPAVVHQHFATWSWPAIHAAAATDIPVIATLHGSDVFMALKPADTAMRRWHHHNVRLVRERAALLLPVSRYLADVARSAGFPPARMEVHYQGIDTDVFVPGDDPHPARVLFVGTLAERKGIRDLVMASTRLVDKVPHELAVVGTGPLSTELRAVALDFPHVRLHGQLDRTGVREQMQRASVMVVPSRHFDGRREPAGLVLLEAQACGTPVIAYASGGMPEMVDPESGVLVTEGDEEELAGAIASVLQADEATAAERRVAARRFVVAERSLRGSARELSEYYSHLAR